MSLKHEIDSLLSSLSKQNLAPNVQKVQSKYSSDSSEEALRDFHSSTNNHNISANQLIGAFERIKRQGPSVLSLPRVTSRLFLARILKDRNFGYALDFLVHDLSFAEAVTTSVETLSSFTEYDRKYCISEIIRALEQYKQTGLARQLLAAVTETTEEHHQTIMLLKFELLLEKCQDLDSLKQLNDSAVGLLANEALSLPASTATLIIKKAIHLGDLALAYEVAQSFPNPDSTKVVLLGFPKAKALSFFLHHATTQLQEIHLWELAVNLLSCSEEVDRFYSMLPDNSSPRLLELLASKALDMNKLDVSRQILLRGGMRLEPIARTLFGQMQAICDKTPIPTSLPDFPEVLSALTASDFSECIERLLDLIRHATAGKYQTYPIPRIWALLKAVDDSHQDIPATLEFKITQIFMHRSEKEVLSYFILRKTSVRSVRALVNHHLQIKRLANSKIEGNVSKYLISSAEERSQKAEAPFVSSYNLISDSFYPNTIRILQKAHVPKEVIEDLFKRIVKDLIQLQPPTAALQFLRDLHSVGLVPDRETVANVIGLLSRPAYHNLILKLLRTLPNVEDSVFATFIVRTASSDPRACWRGLAIWKSRIHAFEADQLSCCTKSNTESSEFPKNSIGSQHDRIPLIVLERVALGFAESEKLTPPQAFKHINSIARELRRRTGNSRLNPVFISALLKCVLIRQGLGVSPLRLGWILEKAREVIEPEQYESLVELLADWRLKVIEELRTPGSTIHSASDENEGEELSGETNQSGEKGMREGHEFMREGKEFKCPRALLTLIDDIGRRGSPNKLVTSRGTADLARMRPGPREVVRAHPNIRPQ